MLCNMAGGGEGNNNLRSFINIIKSLLCLLGTVFIKKKKMGLLLWWSSG